MINEVLEKGIYGSRWQSYRWFSWPDGVIRPHDFSGDWRNSVAFQVDGGRMVIVLL
jgi:hypothetical protein